MEWWRLRFVRIAQLVVDLDMNIALVGKLERMLVELRQKRKQKKLFSFASLA